MPAILQLGLCGCNDDNKQKHIQVHAYLRQFVMETEMSITGKTLTNSTQFNRWIELYPHSTNIGAEKLSSTCESVWVNTNLNDWLSYLSVDQNPTLNIALVAQYRIEAENHIIGITFYGAAVKQDRVPQSGYKMIELGRLKKRAIK